MEGQAVPDALAVLACAGGWLLWSLLVGYLGHRLPAALLRRDSWLTRRRPWGESARGYEQRLQIRRWKDWLPDAGAVFAGGLRKDSLVSRDRAELEQLLRETRRAELVHLGLWPFWILTALWMPPLGVAINLLFATLFNLPCLWLQRFNRLRLEAILQRPGRR